MKNKYETYNEGQEVVNLIKKGNYNSERRDSVILEELISAICYLATELEGESFEPKTPHDYSKYGRQF